ncbi:aquaporin-like protein [Xylariaceae sp. FL0804]|nr:aquaporin-like protein [Xylariaceae sp. FL0804]
MAFENSPSPETGQDSEPALTPDTVVADAAGDGDHHFDVADDKHHKAKRQHESRRQETLKNEKNPPNRNANWVDTRYQETNPWYGKQDKQPVFSLGRPLPRTVRGWVEDSKPTAQFQNDGPGRSKEQLAERGELDDYTGQQQQQQQPPATTTQSEGQRRTANGVSHGERRNDAGQPVFDYIPSRADENASSRQQQQQREAPHHDQSRGQGRDDDEGPSYGIDSEPLGKREHDEVEQGNVSPDEVRNWWARLRARHPEPLAEFLATCVAIFIGLAGTLSVNLSASQATQYGTYETACWAWGFGWMFGIYLGGGVSGAHMNPAISLSLSVFRGFPWRQCGIYVLVQFAGAMVAGALAWGAYKDSIEYADPSLQTMAKTFMSNPREWVSTGSACFNQALGSAIMMIAVFALGDDQNNPPGAGMHAFVLGLLVTTLKFTLGYNTGSALNPASDFGPRVVAYAVGYRSSDVFESGWWLYGPWLSTIAGSIIGCSVYDGFIFVGSESPINYRIPERYQVRARKLFNLKGKK